MGRSNHFGIRMAGLPTRMTAFGDGYIFAVLVPFADDVYAAQKEIKLQMLGRAPPNRGRVRVLSKYLV